MINIIQRIWTAKNNLNIASTLAVSLNLKDDTFRPYHKPDDKILYINIESNHPPNIIKHILNSIENCIQELSSNKKLFQKSKNKKKPDFVISYPVIQYYNLDFVLD